MTVGSLTPAPLGDQRELERRRSFRNSQTDMTEDDDVIGTSQEPGPSVSVSYAAKTYTASISNAPSKNIHLPTPRITPAD